MKPLILALLAASLTACGACTPKPKPAEVHGCAVWSCAHDKAGPTECVCLEPDATAGWPLGVDADCATWTCKHDASGIAECACLDK